MSLSAAVRYSTFVQLNSDQQLTLPTSSLFIIPFIRDITVLDPSHSSSLVLLDWPWVSPSSPLPLPLPFAVTLPLPLPALPVRSLSNLVPP
jgi:hypothetical protein